MQESGNQGLLDGLMTREEAAAELGVGARTLDRWHELRKGPVRTRIGKRVYYDRDDVRAWIMESKERVQRGSVRRRRPARA